MEEPSEELDEDEEAGFHDAREDDEEEDMEVTEVGKGRSVNRGRGVAASRRPTRSAAATSAPAGGGAADEGFVLEVSA